MCKVIHLFTHCFIARLHVYTRDYTLTQLPTLTYSKCTIRSVGLAHVHSVGVVWYARVQIKRDVYGVAQNRSH